MTTDFNCTLLASGDNQPALKEGALINVTAGSVACVKCDPIPSTLEFVGFWFSLKNATEEVLQLELVRAVCFRAVRETDLFAGALDVKTGNHDINITFHVRIKLGELLHMHVATSSDIVFINRMRKDRLSFLQITPLLDTSLLLSHKESALSIFAS